MAVGVGVGLGLGAGKGVGTGSTMPLALLSSPHPAANALNANAIPNLIAAMLRNSLNAMYVNVHNQSIAGIGAA
ncbi:MULTISPECIES: hypothetical protein [unclassified Novosphingobium]|uniref:hypothetical protein n=1 Tax=unclassified Novosphingobium TaxID=2644732 RepID=UPI0025CCA5EC|nr:MULTISPECIES: hypothetical protein [unclassified Novosphingobium]HQV04068.1 hypothetical protein [Novosphingobium sp.]